MKLMIAGVSFGLMLATALSAHADIAAFNKNIVSGDFKAAAAEAAATWPTLDKTRDDIGVIAREFGYAALLAGRNDQARELAAFAASHAGPDGAELQTGATILQRLAEHELGPSSDTRKGLSTALANRAPADGIDNITRIALGTLLGYEGKNALWLDLRHDAKLAIAFAEAGGKANRVELRQFQLYDHIAAFMTDTSRRGAYPPFRELQDSIRTDVKEAASEDAAKVFIPVYWETMAWRTSINAHFGEFDPTLHSKDPADNPRASRLFHGENENALCHHRVEMSQKPAYPSSALFDRLIGTVILEVDIDAQGASSNPRILAAVPEKYFGASVLKSAGNLHFSPGKPWDPATCSIAEKDHVVAFNFQISH